MGDWEEDSQLLRLSAKSISISCIASSRDDFYSAQGQACQQLCSDERRLPRPDKASRPGLACGRVGRGDRRSGASAGQFRRDTVAESSPSFRRALRLFLAPPLPSRTADSQGLLESGTRRAPGPSAREEELATPASRSPSTSIGESSSAVRKLDG